jgi:hypothetical protein
MSQAERRRIEPDERFAVLVRTVPVRLVEVSRGGCLLECRHEVEPGVSGELRLDLDGLTHSDDVRVARCLSLPGTGTLYRVGAELLWTRHPGRRSIRDVIAKLWGNCASYL